MKGKLEIGMDCFCCEKNNFFSKKQKGSQCSVSLYDAKKHAFVLTSTNPGLFKKEKICYWTASNLNFIKKSILESQYILYAPNETVLNEWMQTLKETIDADDTSTNPHELKVLKTKKKS